MAYMSQAKKHEIAAKLKAVVPAGWRYTLAVDHHSTIVFTVAAAPVNLVAAVDDFSKKTWRPQYDGHERPVVANYHDVNVHWLDRQFEGTLLATMRAVLAVLNDGNHDRSDAMTDHFDVGWYVDVRFGRWDRPFVFTGGLPNGTNR